MSTYTIPMLAPSEITEALANFGIANISQHDLNNPNPGLVFDIYTRFLIHLDCLHEEENEQLEFTAMQCLDNPDAFVDSIQVLKLYSKMKEVIESLKTPEKFTLRDLLKPDPKRTRSFLSATVNFCLHRQIRMNTITEIVEEVNLLEEQQRDCEAKIEQLNLEIMDHNEAREREMPFVQEVEAKVKELRQTIAALNNNQLSLRTSHRLLKEKTSEMDEQISSAGFTLVQSAQESANLRSKLVQSPDKLQRALEEKKVAREEAKNAERISMQTFHEKNAIIDVYTKVSKKMSKHLAQMQAIEEQANNAKSTEKDLKALKGKLSDDEVLDKTLEARWIERQGKVRELDELRKKLDKERDLKCEEATKELNSVKQEVESRSHELEARRRNVEAVVAEVDAITARTRSVKEAAAAKLELLDSKYEEIAGELHNYASSIGDVLVL